MKKNIKVLLYELTQDYDEYKSLLGEKTKEWSRQAHLTTDAVFEILK